MHAIFPVPAAYVPAAQFEHAVMGKGCGLNLPAGHAAHPDVDAAKKPALHTMQITLAVPPAYVPDAQSKHAVMGAGCALNLPAGQAAHAVFDDAKNPALHVTHAGLSVTSRPLT